jgi:hypothetical protein
VVDMRPEAITARLRTVARLLAERGFVDKGVDMSCAAVTGRLKTMSALSSMCSRLQQAKIVLTEHR